MNSSVESEWLNEVLVYVYTHLMFVSFPPTGQYSFNTFSWRWLWYFNSLWPSDTISRHKSGSTLAQVMACCLTAPSHYLNQCWLTISNVQWHPSLSNFTRDASAISHWNQLENYLPIILFKSPRGQWVKLLCLYYLIPPLPLLPRLW